MELKDNYMTKNGFVIVKNYTKNETLRNGIKIQDTRGKRDIVCATCLLAEERFKIPYNALVWFPLYAANSIVLEDEEFLVLPFDDIMLIERVQE